MNHVNQKTLFGLAAAAAIAIIAAVVLSSGRRPSSDESVRTEYLIPQLRDHVNDVTSVALTGADSKAIATLQRGDTGWTVKERRDYPADLGKIRELLLKLSDASLLEEKTSNTQRYGELGVSEVSDKDAKGVQVLLGGLTPPASVILGTTSSRGNGTFARRSGEPQSWLVQGALSIDKDAADWLDKSLANLPAERIRSVTIRRADGSTVRVYKEQAGDANFRLADIPRGREPSSDYVVNALGSALADLKLEDVGEGSDAAAPATGKPLLAQIETFDGLRVEISAWKRDEQAFARLKAEVDTSAAERHIQTEQARLADRAKAEAGGDKGATPPPPADDPAKDRQKRLDALGAEAAALSKRFAGWTFVLPSHGFATLDKSIGDLLKPVDAKGGNMPPAKKKPSKR